MRWKGHASHMGERCTGFWWRNLSKRDHLEDVGIMGRRVLKWILKKWD